ncbi:MAG: class I SAM-dependent methyltransferase [Cyclobacteriaceae bacterium]|nr:class I SAM-dependent methyltransferase [Cyclobacteriaceae bacterium]
MKNTRISRGYNRLAPFYTVSAKLVFGNTLQRAQEFFLDQIRDSDCVLILGGGSGELLTALLRQHPRVKIDYVDISPRMIELARRKNHNPDNVNFIIGTERQIPGETYSVVITNFYLDLFNDQTLERVIHQLKPHLATNVTWLATDFVSEKVWHKVFLGMMYAFFKIVTGIQTHTLPHWQGALTKAGMQEQISKKFYRGFIKSSVYKIVQ